MSDQIFLIQGLGQLLEMKETPYDSEALLQSMLEEYPALLAGSQIDRDESRRWLLISRELGVPDAEMGATRWSLDHLFVDQDAIPTLVEVKRSTDTRIRREVVGQMLDYAANGISYWSLEKVRNAFETSCSLKSLIPEDVLTDFLGPDTLDSEAFWKNVESNLKAGRIRMLFVADQIPRELQRIIEFLNEQMSEAEVLGVEIKQYSGPDSGSGMRTIVPRVIGQTATAIQTKAGSPRKEHQWDETTFFAELATSHSDVVPIARRLYEWVQSLGTDVYFGRGTTIGSLVPILYRNGKHQFFAIWTSGRLELYFQWYGAKRPFNNPELHKELLRRLNTIPGLSLDGSVLKRRPTFDLNLLKDEAAMKSFMDTFAWFIEHVASVN